MLNGFQSAIQYGIEEEPWFIGDNLLIGTASRCPAVSSISLRNDAKDADFVLSSARKMCLLCPDALMPEATIPLNLLKILTVSIVDYAHCSAQISLST
jgi:hypothetical protein